MDEKLFHALGKVQTAPSAKGAHDLVAEIGRKVDEEFKIGKEPSGRQILHIIKSFYEVKAEKRDFFELRHLHEFTFWGDSRLHEWKIRWDDLVRNQRVKQDDLVLEQIFIPLCRKSTRLTKHIDHYDRSFEGDPERTYIWMDKMIEKVIKEDRSRVNLESLAAGADASSNPKKAAAGATTGASSGADGSGKPDPKDPKGKGKGLDAKGGGKGKDPKGKGKGKEGKDGGKTSNASGANTPTNAKPDPNR